MPVSRTCTFCGNDIEPGTGKMYVRRDGTIHFFCSSKCQKNQLDLGRVGRKVRWTRRYVRAVQTQAPSPRAALEVVEEEAPEGEEEAEVTEEIGPEAPAEEVAPPQRDRETVVQEFTQLPGVGPATAEALWAAGYTSIGELGAATHEELTEVKGLGPASVKKILTRLQEAGP